MSNEYSQLCAEEQELNWAIWALLENRHKLSGRSLLRNVLITNMLKNKLNYITARLYILSIEEALCEKFPK